MKLFSSFLKTALCAGLAGFMLSGCGSMSGSDRSSYATNETAFSVQSGDAAFDVAKGLQPR
jgi:hypothetical protein